MTIGSEIDGKKVVDFVWSVHVANKKANTFVLVEDGDRQGIAGFVPGPCPRYETPTSSVTPRNNPLTLSASSTIHSGSEAHDRPRTSHHLWERHLNGRVRRDHAGHLFDPVTGRWCLFPNYPKSFPDDSFSDMLSPSGSINTLGHLESDHLGRLIVVGGFGRASAWKVDNQAPLPDDVNNDHWFDDTSDGPVTATIVFDDGSRVEAAGAWVTTTDPSFAPQILNVVSLWDDVYDVWVRQLRLAPHIFDPATSRYDISYKPSFDDDLRPIFAAAALQQWVTNLNPNGHSVHDQLLTITAETDPSSTPLSGLKVFRDPNREEQINNPALMPLHLGDAGEAFLALRKTQYFLLQRWDEGKGSYAPGSGPVLGPGEYLDKAVMVNCLGGRFSPGIDLTFVVRQPSLYVQNWETSRMGPFASGPRLSPTRRYNLIIHCFRRVIYLSAWIKRASSRETCPSGWPSPGTPTTTPARPIHPHRTRRTTGPCSGRGRRSVP